MIDKYTFGDSAGAVNLANIINENDFEYKVTSKVTRILNGFSTTINSTNHIDRHISTYLIGLVYKDYMLKCETLEHEKLKSHTLYVLNTIYKKWLHRKNPKK